MSAENALLLLLPDAAMAAQLHATVLAFLVPPGAQNEAELAAWRQSAGASVAALSMLQAVRALPPRKRQPWFERLLDYSAALPPQQRAALLRDALTLVRADGRLSLHEYLLARLLHRHLSAGRGQRALEQRHLPATELAGPITTVSLAVASLLPGADALPWAQAVLRGLELPPPRELTVPAVSDLNQAIDRLALLGRMHRPALAKRWIECWPARPLPQTPADALRCLCLLIDTPLPPELAAQFDAPPAR